MQMRKYISRLLSHWEAATAEVRAAGASWYREARRTARRVARQTGTTLARACGVLAAISPRLQWKHNVNAGVALLRGEPVSGVFRASLAKARRILAGEPPLGVLAGQKVRAFYRALMGDERAAVVDVWIARAVGIQDSPTARQYADVAAALLTAAERVGTTPARLQAAVWVQVRGRA